MPVQLLMDYSSLHGNDRRQRTYDTYVLVHDSAEEAGNPVLLKSFMCCRGSTMTDATWLPESQYHLPLDGPGAPTVGRDLGVDRALPTLLFTSTSTVAGACPNCRQHSRHHDNLLRDRCYNGQ